MLIMKTPVSKSAFMKAEQCLKHFYLYRNHPNLRDKISKEKQFIFQRGTDVGVFAQQLFPGGVDVTKDEKWNQVHYAHKTKELIERGVETIYEATFIYDDLLVMVDILHKQDGKWIAYEVKSSLKISETYVKDACFQYFVIKNCLQDLMDFNLLTINPNYILNGDLDIRQLFKTTSILKDAIKNQSYFSFKTQLAKETLEKGKIPNIPVGTHCFQPYDCDFLGLCWKGINEDNSIFHLGKQSKQQLFDYYNNGVKTIEAIDPKNLKKEIAIQVAAVKTKEEQLYKEEIKSFLATIKTPYCSLDIEVWMAALPYYQNTKPFQQIPFLFSMIYESNGELKTLSYFKAIDSDLRQEFLDHILSATEQFETILMYDKSLEENVLNQLAEVFPSYVVRINKLKQKIVDVAELVKQGNYYHPDMKGNFSLKSLAPIIHSDCNFDVLEIQSGISAMYIYEGLLKIQNEIEKENIVAQLKQYCEMDALVTFQLYKYFADKV